MMDDLKYGYCDVLRYFIIYHLKVFFSIKATIVLVSDLSTSTISLYNLRD